MNYWVGGWTDVVGYAAIVKVTSGTLAIVGVLLENGVNELPNAALFVLAIFTTVYEVYLAVSFR